VSPTHVPSNRSIVRGWTGRRWSARWLPMAFAVIGLTAVALWTAVGPGVKVEPRIPKTGDQAAGNLASGSPRGGPAQSRPLVATIERFSAGEDLASATSEPSGPGWPQFRGPQRDGIARVAGPLARSWGSDGPPQLWSVELGEGHAGPVVNDKQVLILDYLRDEQADALRCFSFNTGEELWRHTYPVPIKRNHGMSRTVPALADGLGVTLGPKCDLASVDLHDPKNLWLIDLTKEFGAKVPPWYAGQCPLIDQGRAIIAPGGNALMVALDLETGEPVWQLPNPRNWRMTHSSIMPMEVGGRRTFVYCGSGGIAGVAADDGSLLWDSTEWRISIATCPSPVVLPRNRLFLSGGYNSGAMLMRVADDARSVEVVRRLGPREFGSTQHTPIYHDGHIYGVREHDGQLVCLDLDGDVVWQSGDVPRGSEGNNAARGGPEGSRRTAARRFGLGPYLIAVPAAPERPGADSSTGTSSSLIYILDDEGWLTLAEASPVGYHELARAKVLEGHDCWGPMALVDGRLLVRSLTEMACLDVRDTQ